MESRSSPKVFCIGFQKTGTSSLGRALTHLGYRVARTHWNLEPDIAATALRRALDVVDRFDAFKDNPWPLLYRDLDRRYPGSKFILTVRPSDEWIRSVVKHFGTRSTPMREWIYGVGAPAGNEDMFVARYERHNREVRAHFERRDEDLLIMDLVAGQGWEVLCPFLGHRLPAEPFPWANRADSRGSRQRLLVRSKRALRRRLSEGVTRAATRLP